MTVKELKEMLSKMNDDQPVLVESPYGRFVEARVYRDYVLNADGYFYRSKELGVASIVIGEHILT